MFFNKEKILMSVYNLICKQCLEDNIRSGRESSERITLTEACHPATGVLVWSIEPCSER